MNLATFDILDSNSQIQGNDYPLLGTPREWSSFISMPKGMIILPWI